MTADTSAGSFSPSGRIQVNGTMNETWRFHHQPALLICAPISSDVVTSISTRRLSGGGSSNVPTWGGGSQSRTALASPSVTGSPSMRMVSWG